jgi:hypothetical protein
MENDRSARIASDNVITESRVLHARNLCNVCCPPDPRWPDDLKPEHVFHDYTPAEQKALQTVSDRVKLAYDQKAVMVLMPNGKVELQNPRWAFNKILAHPTQQARPRH